MKHIFFKAMAVFTLIIVMIGCFSQPDYSIPDNEIGYDPGTLRNVERISDDQFLKNWVTVSPDGESLLYNEVTVDDVYDKKEKTVTTTANSQVIYLRNARVFAKTPTAVSVENTQVLVVGVDPILNPIVSIPKGMTVFDAQNKHLARINVVIDKAPESAAFYENGINFIYADAERGSKQLVKGNVNSTAKTFITQRPLSNYDSFPSIRDGVIVCQTGTGNQANIVMLREDGVVVAHDVQGGNIFNITLGPGEQPSWHPVEDRVVFVQNGNIMEMNTDIGQIGQQTQLYGISSKEKQDGVFCCLPSYTEDGKHILFLKRVVVLTYKNKEGQEVKHHRTHLYGMDTEGGSVTELTSGNLDIIWYSIGKDNKVFFISNAGGYTEIWSANVVLGE